jgi:hypothetical protein
MKVLILALAFLAACAFAQPTSPVWLNQIRLSGISGSSEQPLAVINGKTLSPGEGCELKLKSRTVHVHCLQISKQSVLVQIQDIPGPCELTFSGNRLILDDSTVAPAPQPVAKVEPPASDPVPVNLFVSALPASQPSSSGKILSLGMTSVFVVIILALLVGIGIGSGAGAAQRWQHRKDVGEAMLAENIGRLFSRPHLLLNNVTLPTADGTTQIDHVLVADTGIFVIETKHYSGWIFGDPKENQWTQMIYRKKSRFQNPLRQNYAHVKTLQLLFDLPEDHFYSVVVFTSDAEFKTDLGPNVVQLAGLIPFLTVERPVLYDERKMAYIVGRIEMKRERRSVETDEYHINHVRRRFVGQTSKLGNQAVFPPPPSNPFVPVSNDDKYKPKASS